MDLLYSNLKKIIKHWIEQIRYTLITFLEINWNPCAYALKK